MRGEGGRQHLHLRGDNRRARGKSLPLGHSVDVSHTFGDGVGGGGEGWGFGGVGFGAGGLGVVFLGNEGCMAIPHWPVAYPVEPLTILM